ncbi:glycosyl hydrolase family 8 [Enterovibrio coralii]|uniref:cellulase n=1 Tax=Enterovibrio coralii TaxID=294935 RepID=A0A135ICF9_9GAMM|nr:glycosyl hydrolase family 8 [Enterovibrio coralii]KXF83105.1 endoglucanase [Enterovibrio coralii]
MEIKFLSSSLLLAITAFPLFANAQCEPKHWMWHTYKKSFVTDEGRVVDTANKRISHSEGQGYGMLLAVHYDDKATFNKLWVWTQNNLQRDVDELFSWKWQPSTPHVPDKNNASDGDILVAWALMRAEKQWRNEGYGRSARNIIRTLQRSHIQRLGGETILLPGAHGFTFKERTVVNPGYWVYPAFDAFSQYDKSWERLSNSGLSILDKNLYGDAKLTPDWLEYSREKWQPADSFAPQFSYSNYRIPLYMVWGEKQHPLNRNYQNWLGRDNVAWVDVISGQKATYQPPPGANAIAQLVELADGTRSMKQGISVSPDGKDYYSDSLVLLSHMAFTERVCK